MTYDMGEDLASGPRCEGRNCADTMDPVGEPMHLLPHWSLPDRCMHRWSWGGLGPLRLRHARRRGSSGTCRLTFNDPARLTSNIATFTAARRRASSPSRTRLECSFSGHVGRRLRSYGSRFRQRPVWSEPAGTSGLGRRGCRRGCRRIRAKPSVARPACRRADRHDQRV
jgi:hypothetical protein